ncbi:MAG: GAF domain-containing protein [Proteobacteria bacterium]|nr:GAF domain-containing protein [Pseudomonadota bacterium]
MREDLAILGELSAKASEDSDFDQFLTRTVNVAIDNTGADCGSLLLVNNQSKTMGEKVLKGLDRDPLNATEIKGVGSLAYQLTQRKEAILTNSIQDRLFSSKPHIEMEGFSGLASYPLVARNYPLGLINLYATRPGKVFGKDEELFLVTISHILGLYLLNSFYALKLKALASSK